MDIPNADVQHNRKLKGIIIRRNTTTCNFMLHNGNTKYIILLLKIYTLKQLSYSNGIDDPSKRKQNQPHHTQKTTSKQHYFRN